jgi:hypothetical protein
MSFLFNSDQARRIFRRLGNSNNDSGFAGPRRRRGAAVETLESRQLLSGEPWSATAKLIAQDKAAANYPAVTGVGQTIAIIDTGVDYRHAALGGALGASHKVVGGYDFVGKDADPFGDDNGHGTAVAAAAAANAYVVNGIRYQGIAPGANVIALREANTAGVKSALDWVLANRAKYNIVAVNMTDFGGGSALTYKDVLKKLIAAGVFVSHPSGNEGPKLLVPAALDPADFSVGSVDASGGVSGFSQRGAELDLLAPGNGVMLPWYDEAAKKHVYMSVTGTSFASPAVVGAAALIKQIDARYTPGQIMDIMQDSGVAVYDAATKLTYRRLDLNAALALAYARKAGTPQPPDATGVGQNPFSGSAIKVTATGVTTIQFENFDTGGENIAYHDAEKANLTGDNYRAGERVDIQATNGGGHHVACVKAGEWLEYTVDVAAAGTFNFAARVASYKPGGTFHVEVDGADKTGTLTVPSSGGWQSWTTVTKSGVAMTAGKHIIRVKADANGRLGYVGNLDSLSFTAAATPVAPSSLGALPPGVRSAFSTTPITAFSSQRGTVRAKTGNYITSLDHGDYLAFKSVAFGQVGATTFTAMIAAPAGTKGKQIQIRLGSPTGQVIGVLDVEPTGSATTFAAQSTTIAKTIGTRNVYLTFVGGNVANIQSIQFA